MNANIRKHHRLIKVVIAIILSGLGYYFNLWGLYVIAAIFVIMAIANFCPADYFGKKDMKPSKKKK